MCDPLLHCLGNELCEDLIFWLFPFVMCAHQRILFIYRRQRTCGQCVYKAMYSPQVRNELFPAVSSSDGALAAQLRSCRPTGLQWNDFIRSLFRDDPAEGITHRTALTLKPLGFPTLGRRCGEEDEKWAAPTWKMRLAPFCTDTQAKGLSEVWATRSSETGLVSDIMSCFWDLTIL